MSKDYVAIEQKYCPICNKTFDTGALLLNTDLRKNLERHTCTGIELCPDHQQMVDSGEYRVFFVTDGPDGPRTGQAFIIRTETASHMFKGRVGAVNHCSMDVFQQMCKLINHAD